MPDMPPETTASTPESSNAAPQHEPKTAKDRSCQFCGQAFTSSSLGRHLDLYIKPKNPKPPDGVHPVDEIRKIRGGITRRQARTDLKTPKASAWKQDEAANGVRRASSEISNQTLSVDGTLTRANGKRQTVSPTVRHDAGRVQTTFNKPDWHVTGVINDLPPRTQSRSRRDVAPTGQAQRMQEMRRDRLGNNVVRPENHPEDVRGLEEAAEVGRAAELALREVLGSLEAAERNKKCVKLFEDFDFGSLAFPGLCLALLPAPATLFSSTPFAAAHQWALSPPGEKQFNAMNKSLNDRIQKYHPKPGEESPQLLTFKYHTHLSGAYEAWIAMPERDRASAWNLELARAFVREQENAQKLKDKLEEALQRVRHVEADYERMSQCQLPREYLLHPPNTLAVPADTMTTMQTRHTGAGGGESSSAMASDYDADALIRKWRTTVRATSRARKPSFGAQTQSVITTQPASSGVAPYTEQPPNQLRNDMLLNGAVFGVNGAMPRNVDPHVQPVEEGKETVMYETPPTPGRVEDETGTDAEAEEGGEKSESDEEVDADADEDVDGNDDRDEDEGNGGEKDRRSSTALVPSNRQTLSNGSGRANPSHGLNANGKRPLPHEYVCAAGMGLSLHEDQD